MTDSAKEKLRLHWTGKKQSEETKLRRATSMKLAHAEGRHPGVPVEILTRKVSKVEDAVAGLLDVLGIPYERQVFIYNRGIARHPWDFVLRDRRILLEVDGCYWHGCPECGFEGVPGRREKDAQLTSLATAAGWRVVRMWEHSIRSEGPLVLAALAA